MATWVQELFPPAFGLTIDDVLKRREHLAEEEQNNSKHDQELRQTLNKKGNEEVGKREIAPLASQKNGNFNLLKFDSTKNMSPWLLNSMSSSIGHLVVHTCRKDKEGVLTVLCSWDKHQFL